MDTPLTLTNALETLHGQKTTARDLAEVCFQKIERLNPKLNAFITVLDVQSALETLDEDAYCLEVYGVRPLEYLRRLDWLGPDVWLAHGVHFNADEVALLATFAAFSRSCPAPPIWGRTMCRA